MLKGRVYMVEQEESGNYQFADVRSYITCGFQETFGQEAQAVAFTALALILENYPDDANYFQNFEYHCNDGEIVKFWCINDVDCITFLLPEEY